MKITKRQIKRIVKEELEAVLQEIEENLDEVSTDRKLDRSFGAAAGAEMATGDALRGLKTQQGEDPADISSAIAAKGAGEKADDLALKDNPFTTAGGIAKRVTKKAVKGAGGTGRDARAAGRKAKGIAKQYRGR